MVEDDGLWYRTDTDVLPEDPPHISEQVGLASRQRRRELGLSQRAYADRCGRSKSAVARVESAAGGMRLDDVAEVLAEEGFALMVLRRVEGIDDSPAAVTADPAEAVPGWVAPAWEPSDLLARTRDGARRFPAHHPVRLTRMGPGWWWTDELMRPRRSLGVRPRWTAEGARGRHEIRLREKYEYTTRPRVEDARDGDGAIG